MPGWINRGTSTNGSHGRRFFSEEIVPSLRQCIMEKHHDNILKLHSLISCILRVIAVQRIRVDVPLLGARCMEAILLIADKYPWVKINHTRHGVLHHSYELVERNDGYGLGSLSEEALESTNKHIRRYLETLSRKTSPVDQMSDVMNRLLERSDPFVLYRRKQLRQERIKESA